MATKTINLTGAEVAVAGLDGAHAHIRNDSTDTIYAAKTAGITAGADGVASIPAGQSDTIRGISGAVYLLGTGSVLIQSDDYVASPFKTSTASGGSAVDEVARTAASTHAGNAEIHVTADEKAAWNGKAELKDIPTTLPANGGNADTLDGLHANEIASNPNLLINPDFKINQRGLSEYNTVGYTADRWMIVPATSCSILSGGGIRVTASENSSDIPARAVQVVENAAALAGKKCTISCEVLSTTAANSAIYLAMSNSSGKNTYRGKTGLAVGVNQCVVDIPMDTTAIQVWLIGADTRVGDEPGMYTEFAWAKLETSDAATTFYSPDPASELAKCQRFYQIRSTGDIDPVDLRPNMAEIKDIRQRSDGKYEYISEP